MDRIVLGKKIKQKREKMKLSQEELSKRLNFNVVKKAETGDKSVSEDNIKSICNYLDLLLSQNGDAFASLAYEVSSISKLVKELETSTEITIEDKDNFDEEVLQILIEMTNTFPNRRLSLVDSLSVEKRMLGILKRLNEKGVVVFYQVVNDSKFNKEIGSFNLKDLKTERNKYGLNYTRENYKKTEFYIYKDDSQKIFTSDTGIRHIETLEKDYKNFYKYLDHFEIEGYQSDDKLYLEIYNYFKPEEVKYLQKRYKNLVEVSKLLTDSNYSISPCKNYISLNYNYCVNSEVKETALRELRKVIGYSNNSESKGEPIKVYTRSTFEKYFLNSSDNSTLLSLLFSEEIYYEILYKLGN
jgi:transcriptional regulator with XRE-family HTH domain